MQTGENVLASIVGAGWHTQTLFPAQLELESPDGSRATVTPSRDTTNPVWITARGPIVANSIFDGETYDARQETPGCNTVSYDPASEVERARKWIQACFVRPPGGCLRSHLLDSIKVVKQLEPVTLDSPREGIHVFDYGQNHAGWCRLTAQGSTGDLITLRFAEVLNEDGTVNQDNLRGASATDVYIMKGGASETWEPRFTYHGYRYVQVEGWPGISHWWRHEFTQSSNAGISRSMDVSLGRRADHCRIKQSNASL